MTVVLAPPNATLSLLFTSFRIVRYDKARLNRHPVVQSFLVDRDPRILQFTVDLQYCRIFFCTAGRARAQISEILRTL